MKIRYALVVATIGAALGLKTSAQAENDGHMDGVWMSVQFMATVNLVNWAGSGPWPTIEKVKLRTARDRCYVALSWDGPNSYRYRICSICGDARGYWG